MKLVGFGLILIKFQFGGCATLTRLWRGTSRGVGQSGYFLAPGLWTGAVCGKSEMGLSLNALCSPGCKSKQVEVLGG